MRRIGVVPRRENSPCLCLARKLSMPRSNRTLELHTFNSSRLSAAGPDVQDASRVQRCGRMQLNPARHSESVLCSRATLSTRQLLPVVACAKVSAGGVCEPPGETVLRLRDDGICLRLGCYCRTICVDRLWRASVCGMPGGRTVWHYRYQGNVVQERRDLSGERDVATAQTAYATATKVLTCHARTVRPLEDGCAWPLRRSTWFEHGRTAQPYNLPKARCLTFVCRGAEEVDLRASVVERCRYRPVDRAGRCRARSRRSSQSPSSRERCRERWRNKDV
ncbi:hypothetical protein OH77DRAFT_1300796 [Trametes cingulata]|nr:hypothetical protein OH77DRAFT_1300796 [Trametes cingulata]